MQLTGWTKLVSMVSGYDVTEICTCLVVLIQTKERKMSQIKGEHRGHVQGAVHLYMKTGLHSILVRVHSGTIYT